MATFTLILNALVAIPEIAGDVETIAAAIVSWYVQRQTATTLAAIADAAAESANAQTEQDRLNAALAWSKALSSSSVTSS